MATEAPTTQARATSIPPFRTGIIPLRPLSVPPGTPVPSRQATPTPTPNAGANVGAGASPPLGQGTDGAGEDEEQWAWTEEESQAWPAEHRSAYKAFEAQKSWGEEWKECVYGYISFEECWHFEDGDRMPAKKRPQVIADFMKTHRNWNKMMEVGDVAEFSSEWWVYWKSLQPEDRWITGDLCMPKQVNWGGTGKWGGVGSLSGKNGLILIMGTLLLWGVAAHKAGDEAILDWQVAVDDVSWAYNSIITNGRPKSKRAQGPPKPKPSAKKRKNDDGGPLPAKRQRRSTKS